MSGLAETLSRLSRLQSGMPLPGLVDDVRLRPLHFSRNPGALNARYFVPADLGPNAPLVVALHGCTQSAAAYDHGTGWSRLAERHGFVVLFPEQRRENNQNLCFNWFSAADTSRDQGEAASIHAMIEAVIAQHGVDPSRVFVTGLSAGGAMANAMMVAYPETFAKGAIIAGLPFGVAHSIPEAFQAMRGQRTMAGIALGALVTAEHPGNVKWPAISVWHGTADRTVDPANGAAIVTQWLNVHGLPNRPTLVETVDGQTRSAWRDSDGRVLVEAFGISGMGHGTPLDPSVNPDEKAGAFMLDVGISSTMHSARSWEIVRDDSEAVSAVRTRAPTPTPTPTPAPRAVMATDHPVAPPAGLRRRPGSIDVGKVINDALRSAGLLR